ncbi:MAG: hypothetical protein ACE5HO_19710 [bacterium]
MAKFFQWLGIDYVQWAALTRASLKKDFRESSMASTMRHGRSGKNAFLFLIFFYLLTGLFFALIVLANQNVFFTATMLIAYTMFMLASLILVEYHTIVISPDDFAVLSYRPISEKTFFFAKLANVLFYVTVLTAAMALPAVVAYTFAHGFSPVLGLLALLSVYWGNLAAALAVILLYTLILKKVSAGRLKNALAYFQLVLSFLIYGGYFFFPRVIDSARIASMRLPDTPWLLCFPPAWFGSLLKLSGGAGFLNWLMLLLAAVATIGLSYVALGKISLGYSERLSSMATLSAKVPVRRSGFRLPLSCFFRGPEERVACKLIWNQFVHDTKFKLAVLSILPLTIFYLLLGLGQGPMPNPFEQQVNMMQTGFLYIAILVFPLMLRNLVTHSDAFRASWIFYVSPAHSHKLILAEKKFIMVFFVGPFLVVLAAIFYYFFRNVLQVLLHVIVLVVATHLFLQLAFLYSPELPFSRPNVRGRRSRSFIVFLLFIPVIVYLVLPIIYKFVYPSWPLFVLFVLVSISFSLLLEYFVKLRIAARMKKLEFTG